jgi:hypothetical protein
MFTKILAPLFIRPDALVALAQLREAWEAEVGSKSLVRTQGSVGLLLFDFVVAAGLTIEEQEFVLGPRLVADIEERLGHRFNLRS